MTKEQKEMMKCLIDRKEMDLIEVIRTFKREGIENFAVVRKEYLDTVLSIIREQDEIINEQLKENVRLQKELNEENKRCMILANNDKFKEQVIDLMAEHIHITRKYECPNIKCEDNGSITCEDCIKQYFERKVEDEYNKI